MIPCYQVQLYPFGVCQKHWWKQWVNDLGISVLKLNEVALWTSDLAGPNIPTWNLKHLFTNGCFNWMMDQVFILRKWLEIINSIHLNLLVRVPGMIQTCELRKGSIPLGERDKNFAKTFGDWYGPLTIRFESCIVGCIVMNLSLYMTPHNMARKVPAVTEILTYVCLRKSEQL